MKPPQVTKLRESLSMSIREFAAALEVDWSTVWRWENGERNVTRPYVRLMEYLREGRMSAPPVRSHDLRTPNL